MDLAGHSCPVPVEEITNQTSHTKKNQILAWNSESSTNVSESLMFLNARMWWDFIIEVLIKTRIHPFIIKWLNVSKSLFLSLSFMFTEQFCLFCLWFKKMMQQKGLLTRYVLVQFPSLTILREFECMHSEIHLP